MGCPYDAVGMQRALDSAIGLPSRSTSALWMLVFLMPADVRRSFMMPLLVTAIRADGLPSSTLAPSLGSISESTRPTAPRRCVRATEELRVLRGAAFLSCLSGQSTSGSLVLVVANRQDRA